jgi:hypothetical protein
MTDIGRSMTIDQAFPGEFPAFREPTMKKRKLNPVEIGPDSKLLGSMFLRRRNLYNLGLVSKSWAVVTKNRRLQEVEKRKFLECVLDIAEIPTVWAFYRGMVGDVDDTFNRSTVSERLRDANNARRAYYQEMVAQPRTNPSLESSCARPKVLILAIKKSFGIAGVPDLVHRIYEGGLYRQSAVYMRKWKADMKPEYPCIRKLALMEDKADPLGAIHPWDMD